MNLTYREVLAALQSMNQEQLDMNVTVFLPDVTEYFPVHALETTTECDVLDENHPYFVLAF